MTPERWFADTNLFLRYLTDDVPEQADAVGGAAQPSEEGRTDPPDQSPRYCGGRLDARQLLSPAENRHQRQSACDFEHAWG